MKTLNLLTNLKILPIFFKILFNFVTYYYYQIFHIYLNPKLLVTLYLVTYDLFIKHKLKVYTLHHLLYLYSLYYPKVYPQSDYNIIIFKIIY